ncbi:hypothetical protein Ccrd_006404 [Cynara cardunculus var. scolymus]|uniref:Uncharacterized protein n=1 Tax=Cynara cardunculus var. scolymus TaxID=59895 RepID=A0A118JUI5_CYNCS|nr:hypothetical protein Ccrd_006404 [Cynara cardunculus var. scolymus]
MNQQSTCDRFHHGYSSQTNHNGVRHTISSCSRKQQYAAQSPGQLFLHSCRHFFGLQRSSLIIAIRVNLSAIDERIENAPTQFRSMFGTSDSPPTASLIKGSGNRIIPFAPLTLRIFLFLVLML